ncbi:hypothetical protein NMY3_03041 [Candidatus Nitrosocosmicus oleophilus]|uniref:Uncharacterized protein n=1 Tax=Candidatus Nitrosocosmicus oleophilus TaxID=1353260 RepID=A0A654M0H2_9ARCH|nr:hypothetical protein [Candidatus Nitrosocosmicus oleophilus]ALI37228.1 hypothetical protein NMY3_03041 [Candidatus Nitrosocosmicus oleophilus]
MHKMITFGFLTVLGFISIICPLIPQQINGLEIVSITLDDERKHSSDTGRIIYNGILDIKTNSSDLKGIEEGSGRVYISVAEDQIGVKFPLKVPDALNSNKMNVEDLNFRLDVNSVETSESSDLKIYHAYMRSSSDAKMGDKNIREAIVEQSDDGNKANLILILY